MTTTLWAVSDLHAAVKANRPRVEDIQPRDPSDWLIVAGDVAERTELVVAILAELAERFDTVIWVPGNHELYTRSADRYKGREKYEHLVDKLREVGVITPEDVYPVFAGVTIAPLFTLYDYSFRVPTMTADQALESAREKDLMLTDEVAIAPFADIRAWCWDRLAYSTRRLSRISGPTILVNHWPLVQEATDKLYYREIALWCGTRHTRGWAKRYNAQHVIYGHLHMPGTLLIDGTPHTDVSLGYPDEWRSRENQPPWPYPVLEVEL